MNKGMQVTHETFESKSSITHKQLKCYVKNPGIKDLHLKVYSGHTIKFLSIIKDFSFYQKVT